MKKRLIVLMLWFLPFVGISQIVYQEDFNTNDGSWIATGINNDWAWGTPVGTDIVMSGSVCGGDAWVTNLSGDYGIDADGVLTSPVIDCSGHCGSGLWR